MATLKDTLDIARRNLGFVEGPNNDNPYAPLVGHANHQPWCASFVAAVMKRAGVELPSTSAYTPTMANGFKKAGRWHSKGQAGDVVFFEWPGMGRIAHVGLVEVANADGTYICIEGNTDSRGGRTGGRVMRQHRKASIAGFGRLVYAKEPVKAPVKKVVPPKTNVPAGNSPVLGLQEPKLYGPKVADVQRHLLSLDPGNRTLLGTELTTETYGKRTSELVSRYKVNRGIDERGWGSLCWARARKEIAEG